jgi:uncharacterized membrane protein SirB2
MFATSTWASAQAWIIIGVCFVIAWVVSALVITRNKRQGTDPALIAKRQRSLYILGTMIVLIAIRLISHVYG